MNRSPPRYLPPQIKQTLIFPKGPVFNHRPSQNQIKQIDQRIRTSSPIQLRNQQNTFHGILPYQQYKSSQVNLLKTSQPIMQFQPNDQRPIYQIRNSQQMQHRSMTDQPQAMDLKYYEENLQQKVTELENTMRSEDYKMLTQEDYLQIEALRSDNKAMKQQLNESQNSMQHPDGNIDLNKKLVHELQQHLIEAHQNINEKNILIRLHNDELVALKNQLNQAQADSNRRLETVTQLQIELSNANDAVIQVSSHYDDKIAYLVKDMSRKENRKNEEIQELLGNLSDHQGVQESLEAKMVHVESEVNTWRKRFVELNREFHNTQEQFIMCQAELEYTKRGVTPSTNTPDARTVHITHEQKSKGRTSIRAQLSPTNRQSEYEQSVLSSSDMALIDKLSKQI